MWSHIVPSAVNVAGHWLTPESIHDQLGIYEPGAMDYANLAFTMMGANRLIKGGKNLNQLRKDYLTGKPVQLNPLHRTAQKGIAKDKLDYWAKNNPNATSEELSIGRGLTRVGLHRECGIRNRTSAAVDLELSRSSYTSY